MHVEPCSAHLLLDEISNPPPSSIVALHHRPSSLAAVQSIAHEDRNEVIGSKSLHRRLVEHFCHGLTNLEQPCVVVCNADAGERQKESACVKKEQSPISPATFFSISFKTASYLTASPCCRSARVGSSFVAFLK